ncbi:MAG: S-methyl-5'-thioadenosine phosphorylase [Terriglobia bacterium]
MAGQIKLGIIGGSGLYGMAGLRRTKEVRVTTPFGSPSDAYRVGTLEGRRVAFLARHGRGHRILPSELNFRANIYGFKKLGVERILSVSAVGSLKEELKPMEFVIPDQFFDRTRGRISTFFGNGIVAHVSFAHPVCPVVVKVLADACRRVGVTAHSGGTYVCMEGPMFSTQAESHTYRNLGFAVIGMTNLQEAKLAREAEICYATVAMVTDYDCWHPQHDAVTGHEVMENLARNIENVQKVIREAVPHVPEARTCTCGAALAHAIITEAKKIPLATRKRLALLISKYIYLSSKR